MIRVHIFVEGRVHGVGYRANTRRIANQLALKGWVRNLRDGRVEIMAEGDEEMVDRLIQWCYRGPTSAYVTKVNVDRMSPIGEFDGFTVKSSI